MNRLERLKTALGPGRTQLGVGPMSLACVDATIELANEQQLPLLLIGSRRQIECASQGGGYVNGWSTETFARYVRERDKGGYVLLCRDHGGPWQNYVEVREKMSLADAMKSAKASFDTDIASGYDIIHIDPSCDAPSGGSRPQNTLELVFDLYDHVIASAEKQKQPIFIEVGTEEQNGGLNSPEDVSAFLKQLESFCVKRRYQMPLFVVAQTGTLVKETRNVGHFVSGLDAAGRAQAVRRVTELVRCAASHGVFIKEHNGDYLSDDILRLRPRMGIGASNVAPEFGVAETRFYLEFCDREGMKKEADQFLELSLKTRKWEKWLVSNTSATDRERAIIAGHYVFGTPEFKEIYARMKDHAARRGIDLDRKTRDAVKASIARYLKAFGLVSSVGDDPAIYGGNSVRRVAATATTTVFSDNAYYYSLINLAPKESVKIDWLGEYTLFVKQGAKIDARANGDALVLGEHDAVDLRGAAATVTNGPDAAQLLVAGVRTPATDHVVQLTRADEIKKVFKPWGHELWINGLNKGYSLKEVFLKAGRKTSLQYHRMKQETNVLFGGKAAVWYKQTDEVENDAIADEDIAQVSIEAVTSVDVVPQTIHRLEALTDILLYESSTPHLEDVVRLRDDNNRKSGTVASEHKLDVVILTAGKGERMGGLCDILNKALLPLRGKAVISWMIDKFPKSTRFVIALGYRGEQVKHYLKAAYPNREIEFVTVDNWDKPGAGPGYSLKQCKPALGDRPFYFLTCDTVVEDDIPFDVQENWMGVYQVNYAISQNYCNFTIENNRVAGMIDKEPYADNHSKSYIGFSYIHDTADFWAGLESQTLRKGEWQMTNGIHSLIGKRNVRAIDFKWRDVGSYQQYLDLVNETDKFDFSKSNEFLYMVNSRVVKFFNDASMAQNRAKRVAHNPTVFPTIDYADGQFFAYPFVPGETLYAKNDAGQFDRFLGWLDAKVWKRVPGVDLEAGCKAFYKDKTLERIGKLFEKYPRLAHNEKSINGQKIPALEALLGKLDWDTLVKNHVPAFIHGDLQFDNVVADGNGFTLIDWRQDFAGRTDVGDLYYDLAKIYGGLVLNYDLIKDSKFSYSEDDAGIRYDFLTRGSMADYQAAFERFIVARGLDLKKVKTLVALIYLNMSPLHNYPFDKMLFALGCKRLNDELAA